MKDITVIYGGSFGSEGKGLAASWLAKRKKIQLATTCASYNAGHTAVVGGEKVITYHLPMAGVLSPNAILYLNAGALIHPAKLMEELATLDHQGFNVSDRLLIHPHAAIIEDQDIIAEGRGTNNEKISGTQKGVGAAAARKMLRTAKVAMHYKHELPYDAVKAINPMTFDNIAVEVAQGYSLGINAGFYPFCTHRACTPTQGLMNAMIPTTYPHEAFAVIRINPIRVGSLPNGYSGGCYSDQKETTWEALGVEPSYTTVTKRLRRVFTYSYIQLKEMLLVTKPSTILINFCNQASVEAVRRVSLDITSTYAGLGWKHPYVLYGYGPEANDIKDHYELRSDHADDLQRSPDEDGDELRPRGY